MFCGSGGLTSRLAKSDRCGAIWSFWSYENSRIAPRCGAKHVSKSKSKCYKHFSLGALLEVGLFKKCTPLWPEEHFKVKMLKAHHFWGTFGS